MCTGCGFSGCGGMCGCDDWESTTTLDVVFTCACGNVWMVENLDCDVYGRGRSGAWYASAECTDCGAIVEEEGEISE